ncbi:hypothetical protein IIB79_02580 [candidate division KSB1 bacterium]|nr:hypothetical protein [candidate division KSB1 bacterium]
MKTLVMATELLEEENDQKVMFLVQARLREKATVWWIAEKNQYYDEQKDEERTKLPPLTMFLKAFREEYMSADERRRWLQKFCGRKQKWEESVEEYLADLKDLKARSGYQVMPDMMLVQFLEGLRPRIRDQVKVQQPSTLREASERAVLVEEILKGNKKTSNIMNTFSRSGMQRGRSNMRCYNCNGLGHFARDFRKRRQEGRSQGEGPCRSCGKRGHSEKQCWAQRKCYNCDEKGHLARNCPKRNYQKRKQFCFRFNY